MTDTLHRSGGAAPTNRVAANSYNPIAGATAGHPDGFPAGTPVVQSTSAAGTVIPGIADDEDTSFVVGMTTRNAVVGSEVIVQLNGPIGLTAEQWDAITGDSGGLIAGSQYFLSSANEGQMTTTAPTGNALVVQIGIALSTTDFLIKAAAPVAAAGSSTQSSFAMFFGTTNGTGNSGNLYGGPIPPGDPIQFPISGPSMGSLISRVAPSNFADFQVGETGLYEVSWTIAFTTGSQLELFVNNFVVDSTCAMSASSGGINTNTAILSLTAGDQITLRIPFGNTASLNVQADDAVLTHAQAPNLIIKFLGAS